MYTNETIRRLTDTIRRETARIPTAASGLGLGIASLGWVLEQAAPFGGIAQGLGAFVASILLVGVAAKFILHPAQTIKDLDNPLVGSIMPTFGMGLMVVSRALAGLSPAAGVFLWCVAVVTHLVFLAGFVWCRARHFRLADMLPSWFIPPVGIITAVLTSPGGALDTVSHWLLLFGLINFALLLPVMVCRLVFLPEIPDAAKPTIAILAAPASLSLAGYLSHTAEPSVLVVFVLLGVALLTTATIYLALPILLRLPFSPAFASFTFPLVIGATALFKAQGYLAADPLAAHLAAGFRGAAFVELCVATIIVFYVVWRYARAGHNALARQATIAPALKRRAAQAAPAAERAAV